MYLLNKNALLWFNAFKILIKKRKVNQRKASYNLEQRTLYLQINIIILIIIIIILWQIIIIISIQIIILIATAIIIIITIWQILIIICFNEIKLTLFLINQFNCVISVFFY